MTRRPYPTKAAWTAHLARLLQAKAEGRICPRCQMNITDKPGTLCVACKPTAEDAE